MMVSYFETYLRDTNIYALTSQHNLIKGLRIKLRYAYYDLNAKYTVNVKKGIPEGDDYMHAYGLESLYNYNDQLSLKVIVAGRSILKY